MRPTRTTWRRTARRSGRCTTARSCSTASRSRWCVAETSEIARYAASLVRVEYEQGGARHGHFPPARRGRPGKARQTRWRPCSRRRSRAASRTRRWPRPRCATRPSISCRSSITTRWSSMPRRWSTRPAASSRSTTRPRACRTCRRYLCGVFGMKPEDVRVMSPFMGGGFGSGLRPQFQVVLAVLAARALQRSVRLVLTRQQMYVLGYRPAMIQKHRARRQHRRDARRDHARRGDHHFAIRGLPSAGDRLVRPALQVANAKYAHRLAQLDLPTSCDMRAPSAATALFALESAMEVLR